MILFYFFIVIAFLAGGVYVFLRQPKFGRLPSGDQLNKIKHSVNYRDGKFQNQHLTPDLKEGVGYFEVLKGFIFGRSKRGEPSVSLPSQKTDIRNLPVTEDVLVWFGHSSYFLQVRGKRILVDPVFSGSASPVKFTTRSYPGTDVYNVEDIPEIDYLFLSHDHWDHLDFETLVKLKSKVKQVITGLGVGTHLEHWGYESTKIIERDWNEEIVLDRDFVVNTLPARHFSGRGLTRTQSIWSSFVLKTPDLKLFLGGDSGYDTHFTLIGEAFGPFDLVLLECGQYDEHWKYIHMMPEEVVQAAIDLKAKQLMPVHWAKFTLGKHAWDEPIIRVTEEARRRNLPVVHPMIGECVRLKEMDKTTPWWENID